MCWFLSIHSCYCPPAYCMEPLLYLFKCSYSRFLWPSLSEEKLRKGRLMGKNCIPHHQIFFRAINVTHCFSPSLYFQNPPCLHPSPFLRNPNSWWQRLLRLGIPYLRILCHNSARGAQVEQLSVSLPVIVIAVSCDSSQSLMDGGNNSSHSWFPDTAQ